jgi:3-hydroxyisobutyrate dehydrogenase-like beta-hydroxyacid dehydrogenase
MRIGFIGAGRMGHGMVLGLLGAGHEVSVIAHRNRAPVEDLVSRGAIEAPNLETLAESSEYILFCVSSSIVVSQILAGLKPHLRRGQTLIDAGTSEPAATRQIARELATLGVAYADAPLTGGPEQAAKHQLGVLCGASLETFQAIAPLLGCFASTIRHMGPVGSGHTAKLISNYLVTGMIALVSEAFRAASASNIDWRNLYEAMLNGSGNSGVLRKMVEPALTGDFQGYSFSLENALKDISYFKNLGHETALARAVHEIFANAVRQGRGSQNVSQLLNS